MNLDFWLLAPECVARSRPNPARSIARHLRDSVSSRAFIAAIFARAGSQMGPLERDLRRPNPALRTLDAEPNRRRGHGVDDSIHLEKNPI